MMQGESGCKKAGRRPKPSSGRFRRASPAGPGGPGGRGGGGGPHPGAFGWGATGTGGFLFTFNGGGGGKAAKRSAFPGKSLRHKPRRVALDECLVEIDGKGQLINADVFIFPVHRGILLPVDINGGKTVGIGYCPKRCGYRYIYSGFRWKPCCCGAPLESEQWL